jgi:hypothetical protein
MHFVDRTALEAQLATAAVISRENTGAGFYTRFLVEAVPATAIGGKRLREGPTATIGGLQHGMGFILWLNKGYADCLEGYSYQESTVEIVLELAEFEILA